jgi:hypothetical protein
MQRLTFRLTMFLCGCPRSRLLAHRPTNAGARSMSLVPRGRTSSGRRGSMRAVSQTAKAPTTATPSSANWKTPRTTSRVRCLPIVHIVLTDMTKPGSLAGAELTLYPSDEQIVRRRRSRNSSDGCPR